MSWLSSGIKKIGKVATNVGHAAGSVLSNPLVEAGLSFIPGVGPVAAGAAGAIGGALKPHGGLKGAVSGAVKGGAAAGIGKLAGAIPGVSSLGGKLGGLLKSVPGAGAVQNIGQRLGKVGGQIDAASGGEFTKLGQAARKGVSNEDGGLDLGKIIGAVGAGSAIVGQQQQNKAAGQYLARQEGMQDKLLGQADADYQARAPLRDAAIGKLSGLVKGKRSADVYRPFLNKEMNASAT